jgi:hypothetical protein
MARTFIIIIGSAQAPGRHPTSAVHARDDGSPFHFESPAEVRAEIKRLQDQFPGATFEMTRVETRENVGYQRVLATLLLLRIRSPMSKSQMTKKRRSGIGSPLSKRRSMREGGRIARDRPCDKTDHATPIPRDLRARHHGPYPLTRRDAPAGLLRERSLVPPQRQLDGDFLPDETCGRIGARPASNPAGATRIVEGP